MIKIILILLLVFIPGAVYSSLASDFTVNRQSTYSIPPGTSQVLILDLTLPQGQLESIKINNSGTALHLDISKMVIWQDGSSAGWDGDENEMAKISSSPFWDIFIPGGFSPSQQRIFVTVDVASTAVSERTIKPQLVADSVVFSDSTATGPTDTNVIGFERMIRAGVSLATQPVAPLAGAPEALSTSTVRWHFTDLSNNEFGFKILDSESNIVARKDEANLSYLDETGLTPDTEYSGRRVAAFNDRGKSLSSSLTVFSAVRTLAEEITEEVVEEEVVEEAVEEIVEEGIGGPFSIEELRAKITEIQLQIIELLNQLIELFQQQLARVGNFLAGLWITLF